MFLNCVIDFSDIYCIVGLTIIYSRSGDVVCTVILCIIL